MGLNQNKLQDRIDDLKHDLNEARNRVRQWTQYCEDAIAERDEARADVRKLTKKLSRAKGALRRLGAHTTLKELEETKS